MARVKPGLIKTAKPAPQPPSHIVIASDHAGIGIKRFLIPRIVNAGYPVEDVGHSGQELDDDYPEYAIKVAGHVASSPFCIGILVCGTGIGMDIAANKVAGIRAALCTDEFSARMAREHNDANILVLRARRFPRSKAWKITQIFLRTPFSDSPRHRRRIAMIEQIEKAGKR